MEKLTHTATVRLPADTVKIIKRIAKQEERKFADVLRRLIIRAALEAK